MTIRFMRRGCSCGVALCEDDTHAVARDVVLCCDACNRHLTMSVPNPRATLAGQRARARRRGWSTRRAYVVPLFEAGTGKLEDLCPACAARETTRRIADAQRQSAFVTSPGYTTVSTLPTAAMPLSIQTQPAHFGLMRNPFIRHDAARIVTMTLFDP